MDLLGFHHGFTMVSPWFHHGFTMVSPWFHHGFTISSWSLNVFKLISWSRARVSNFRAGQLSQPVSSRCAMLPRELRRYEPSTVMGLPET